MINPEKQDATPLLEPTGGPPAPSRASSSTSLRPLPRLLAACGLLAFALYSATTSSAPPLVSRPLVALDYGTFRGRRGLVDGVDSFLGIPFAQPPVGPLRYRRALVPPNPLDGVQDASSYGHSCAQVRVTNGQLGGIPSEVLDRVEAMPNFQVLHNDSEDVSISSPGLHPR